MSLIVHGPSGSGKGLITSEFNKRFGFNIGESLDDLDRQPLLHLFKLEENTIYETTDIIKTLEVLEKLPDFASNFKKLSVSILSVEHALKILNVNESLDLVEKHTPIKNDAATTARFSCSGPNISNIPKCSNSNTVEELLQSMVGTRNILIGMTFDHTIRQDIKETIHGIITKLHEVLDKYEEV